MRSSANQGTESLTKSVSMWQALNVMSGTIRVDMGFSIFNLMGVFFPLPRHRLFMHIVVHAEQRFHMNALLCS